MQIFLLVLNVCFFPFSVATPISARKDAERKIVEARGVGDSQKILSESLTDKILKMKAIKTTQKLAESQNTKVLMMGGGQDKLPLILSNP